MSPSESNEGPTGGITIFYRVDTRESDTEVLINFTGKLICNLREAVKARSKLTHPPAMLKLVVASSDKTEIDLEELRKSWTQQGISFSFAKLISEYDINKDNPILVKAPAVALKEAVIQDLSKTSRKRKRWEDLNLILNANTKAKRADGVISTGCSCARWADIRKVYEPIREMTILPKMISWNDLDNLQQYLGRARRALGFINTANKAKRLHFIAPIFIYLNDLFKGDMKIHVEESVVGKNIHCDGNFEFVIQRGRKKVCIVVANSDDMEQGITQDLLGCEAIADTESLDCVFGIVTNFLIWVFFKSVGNHVEQEETTLSLGDAGVPTKRGLQKVVGKIYALLSDD